MNTIQITKAATSQSIVMEALDVDTGLDYESIVYNTTGIALWYWRPGATKTAITPATLATADAAYSSGGVIHIDDGVFRLDLPDAAVATGVDWVIVGGEATGVRILPVRVQLADYTNTDLMAKLNLGQIVVQSPVTATEDIPELISGGTYNSTLGNALQWTVEDWSGPAVGTLTVSFSLMLTSAYDADSGSAALTVSGSVAMSGDDAVFSVALTAAQTAALETKPPLDKWGYTYRLKATDGSSNVHMLKIGRVTVLRDVA